MGGDITVQSTPDEGSTFTVTIDLGSLEGTALLEAPLADGVASSSQNSRDNEQQNELSPSTRILLVEDGEINRKLIIALFTQAGLTKVDTAENGVMGVQRAREKEYDIILMDMQMPVMDGYTAARTLRDLGHETPIIALTAHAMKGDLDKCIAAGCTDYLSKPIDGVKLFGKISTLTPPCKPDGKTVAETQTLEISDKQNVHTDKMLETTLPIHNEVFLEIVQDFGDLLVQMMAELQTKLEQQDRERIKQLAHDIAGTAGGAGFGAFTDPARHLESIALTDNFSAIKVDIEILNNLAARVSIPEFAT